MNLPPLIDSKDGIQRYLTDLSGLAELVERRRQTADAGKELEAFVVLGRWLLDREGRCHPLSDPNLLARYPGCPDVLTLAEAFLVLRGDTFSSTYEKPFPGPEDTCRICGEGWTLGNAHEFVDERQEGTLAHLSCFKHELARKTKKGFRECFEKAGFSVDLVSIPNEYDPSYQRSSPWFLAQVEDYPPIKIGWRKRVINIDWGASDLDLEEDFADETVTKSDHFIHAWSYAKATEYLKVIVTALEENARS